MCAVGGSHQQRGTISKFKKRLTHLKSGDTLVTESVTGHSVRVCEDDSSFGCDAGPEVISRAGNSGSQFRYFFEAESLAR